MKFAIAINVMPKAEISDPQGQAVARALPGLGLGSITEVRVGKRILVQVEAPDAEAAAQMAEQACMKILTNPVIEEFSLEIGEHVR
ncbi:MAG: phosphoribosylformylglycinamidine synthase subunit PurS [Actinomycetota bacterium]